VQHHKLLSAATLEIAGINVDRGGRQGEFNKETYLAKCAAKAHFAWIADKTARIDGRTSKGFLPRQKVSPVGPKSLRLSLDESSSATVLGQGEQTRIHLVPVADNANTDSWQRRQGRGTGWSCWDKNAGKANSENK